MINLDQTRRQLVEAKEELDKELSRERDADNRSWLERRSSALEREIADLDQHHPPQVVFVSFSQENDGHSIYEAVARALKSSGFLVLDGMGKGRLVRDVIADRIRRSSVFVGIMNKHARIVPEVHEAEHDREERSAFGIALAGKSKPPVYSPGVWVITEAGMAYGFGKPMVLLVHEDVDSRYWKLYSHFSHPQFNESSFDRRNGSKPVFARKKVNEIVEAVKRTFSELQG